MRYSIDDILHGYYFCIESFCGPAPLVDNGYIVNSTGVYGGDKVTYSCKNGYSTTQSLVIMCRSNGVWGTVPSCQGQCLYTIYVDKGLDGVNSNRGIG